MRRDGGVADAVRASFALLLAFSLAWQAQLSGAHFHLSADGSILNNGSQLPSDDPKNHDPKSDNQCLLCQQLASAHNYLFSAAQLSPNVDPAAETIFRHPELFFLSLRQSFNWLSRAPPQA